MLTRRVLGLLLFLVLETASGLSAGASCEAQPAGRGSWRFRVFQAAAEDVKQVSMRPSPCSPPARMPVVAAASFNRWLVRYIYVPLGGTGARMRWNVFVVFLFVAFWHDVEPKLFVWGLLNGTFILLEVLVAWAYKGSGAFESCRAHPFANR